MGTDLSWTTINRAHQRGNVQMPTAKLISKICLSLGGKPVPFVSMMEPCEPPPPLPKVAKKVARKKKK